MIKASTAIGHGEGGRERASRGFRVEGSGKDRATVQNRGAKGIVG